MHSIATHLPGQGPCRSLTPALTFTDFVTDITVRFVHRSLHSIWAKAIAIALLLLMQQLFDVVIEKVALQLRTAHVFRASNPLLARAGTTVAGERLSHLPLGARVEEGQLVAFLQAHGGGGAAPTAWAATGRDADLNRNRLVAGLDVKL